MLFSTIGQGWVFLWMTGAGLLTGALYALFTALRRLFGAGFWLTLFMDAVFGVCAALILIAALVTGSYGRVRLYELLGAVLGIILFSLGVEPPLKWLCTRLGRMLRRLYDKIVQFRLIKVIFR